MTAHYNGYFNANELIQMSISTYRSSLKEDYYSILPIDPVPNATEVTGLYASIDTAIVKCTKVIQNHSMPSNDRPSKKKAEYNQWIDENWTTIGIADYYRRDYEAAMKNFEFIKKFYSNDPTLYIADLWMAKTNIAIGNYTEAHFSLSNLDKVIEEEELLKAEKKGFFKKKEKTKEKTNKEDKIAKFPKKIRFDFEKTKAELALKNNNKEEAIKNLEESLKFAKKQTDKSRVHFILAQLYEATNNRVEAKNHYSKVLKYNSPYEMNFSARIRRAFMGGDEKFRKDLIKMLRDAKNSEFKDQIYYALAEIELQKNNKPKAKEYLTLSAFYSNSNTRQKGMAYEKLGNLSFTERNYVTAQKYYDSCVTVVNDQYPNYEGVKNKAIKLFDLVKAVETYEFEDSVQKISKLPIKEREEFVENVIKKIKKDEETRKKMEAQRLIELQKNQSLASQSNDVNGNKWYWNNSKTRTEGFDEFKKLWGVRVNEDNWRRSEKITTVTFKEEQQDSTIITDSIAKVAEDTLTIEKLMSRVPLTDSAFNSSTIRLLSSLYDAGVIYKEQLMENEMAIKQFLAVLDRKENSDFNLLSAYQLYRIYSETNKSKAEIQKEYILNMYPNSDYANYLRDPEYFIKKKARDAIAEQEYLSSLDRYNRGLYHPVISKASMVIISEKDNLFRAKYMLLKAMSMGQVSENKEMLIPTLEQLIKEYPNSEEEKRANELLSIIKTGVSQNLEVDFNKKSIYSYDDKAVHWVLIFIDKKVSSTSERTKVSDFNREFFGRDKLKTSSKIYGNDQSVILVEEFKLDKDALEYIRVFKKTRKHLLDLQKAKIILITRDNLKLLFETQKLQEYEDFMLEYY
jgi:tetratricopeptide (TPR) repeat protein